MNPGSILIKTAFIVSLITLMFCIKREKGTDRGLMEKVFYASGLLIFAACAVLLEAFLSHRYYYSYVHENSSNGLPVPYLVAAFWAGKEGSFLLWILFLNVMGVIASRREGNDGIMMSVIVMTQSFLLFVVAVESPFSYVWAKRPDMFLPGDMPADGLGMNTLLINPWMVVHPPVLFAGYASATVPFAFAVSALARNTVRDWIEKARPWIMFSMITLGAGIFLGGYWAYIVLGWGGYWGWDPVENSSLIPWLVVLALVHGVVLQRKRGVMVRTNIVLSSVYLILVFYSTFLTRSGVLSNFSVHSFSESAVSKYLVSFILFYLAISVFLFVKNRKKTESRPVEGQWSWDMLCVYGITVILAYSGLVLFGTSMPIISVLFADNPVAVTESFYNSASIPIALVILVIMAASLNAMISKKPFLKKDAVFAGLAAAVSIAHNAPHTSNPVPYALTAASLFVVAGSIYDLVKIRTASLLPSRLSHIGLAVLILGISSSGYHSSSEKVELVQGIKKESGGMSVVFRGMAGSRKTYLVFDRSRSGINGEIRTPYYTDAKMKTLYREPYIEAGLLSDLYISPLSYSSGTDMFAGIEMTKGETRTVGDLRIEFIKFNFTGMATSRPVIFAELRINGAAVSPGIRITDGGGQNIDAVIGGTGRKVSLAEINANSKKIVLGIDPDPKKKFPESAVIEISRKRLMWLVWLGSIMMTAGGAAAFIRTLKSSGS